MLSLLIEVECVLSDHLTEFKQSRDNKRTGTLHSFDALRHKFRNFRMEIRVAGPF